MPVLGPLSYTLEVADLRPGVKFYTDAGLDAAIEENIARFRCPGQDRNSIVLLGGAARKRLCHISLRATRLEEIAARTPDAGGRVIGAPAPFASEGLWIEDPLGMVIHLSDRPADSELAQAPPFEINGPGRIMRKRSSAMLPGTSYPSVKPLRLGHILVFSPDVMKSVGFMVEALGMGLADRAQEVIAFTCARKDSDHHVVAFAKSPGPAGFGAGGAGNRCRT